MGALLAGGVVTPQDQRVPSNRVQTAIVLSLATVLAALDWVVNGRWATAVVVAVAIALGAGIRLARRRSQTDERPN